MAKEPIKPLYDCLSGALKELGLAERFGVMRLFHHWSSVAGKRLAGNTKLLSVEPPTVTIAAFTSVWLQQLQMTKAKLLQRINEFYGQPLIKDLKFVMYRQSVIKEQHLEGIDADPIVRPRIDFNSIVLTPDEVAAIDKSLASVQNSELKAKLREVQVKQKKKEKYMLNHGYRLCESCGHYVRAPHRLCLTCAYEQQRQRIVAVRKWLHAKPYWKWDDMQKQLPSVTMSEYNEAKREVIYYYLDRIYTGSQDSVDLYTAAMLITGKTVEELTPQFVINLTNRYRPKPKTEVVKK